MRVSIAYLLSGNEIKRAHIISMKTLAPSLFFDPEHYCIKLKEVIILSV